MSEATVQDIGWTVVLSLAIICPTIVYGIRAWRGMNNDQ